MPTSRFLDFTAPALFATLLGASIYAAWLEGRSFLSAPGDAHEGFSLILEGGHAAGLSTLSKRYLLADCEAALSGPYGRLQPQENRERAAGVCRDAALGIIGASPLSGHAYAVAGQASAVLGQPEAAIAYLVRSAQATPYESWLAHQRVMVVQEWALDGDADMARTYRRDLAVMGMTQSGRQWLARLYVFSPERREVIVSAIDGLDEAHKRAFLQALRLASAAQ